MTNEEIKAKADEIIAKAKEIAAGEGRDSTAPANTLTDGRQTYTPVFEGRVSGAVAASIYIEDESKGITDALFVKSTNDAACEAIDRIEAAAKEMGVSVEL